MNWKSLHGEHLKGASLKQLAIENNLNRRIISKIFKERGYEIINWGNKKYTLNHKFFDEIDNQSKAYILGFTHGDGSNRLKEIQYTVTAKDITVLEYIKKCVGSNYKIKHLKPQKIKSKKKTYLSKSMVYFRMCSRHMGEKLKYYGIVPNKTFVTYIPRIDGDLLRHFIRGSFDAGGCFSTYKNTYTQNGKQYSYLRGGFSIVGSKLYVTQLQDHFKSLGINLNIRHFNDNIASVRTSKLSDIKKIYNYLYKDYEFCLERKRLKMIDYINIKDVQRS